MNNMFFKDDLTKKQTEYIAYLASGLSVKETAEFCNVSKHTVRNTVTKAKERIGAASTSNLIAWATARGYIEIDDGSRPFLFYPCRD